MKKITIIGSGRVGESTAQFIAEKDLCKELMLIDIREGIPQGVALDIRETAPLLGFDTKVNGCHQAEGVRDSDLVIITAGLPRKDGMSRSDVLAMNVKIIEDIVSSVVLYAPDAIVLLASNPVDTLTYQAFINSGFDRRRIIGQSGVLNSARMASFIAMETGLSTKGINALVLGGHGNNMVPMVRFTTISGIGIEHLMEESTIGEIIELTRSGGADILNLRKTRSVYDAPAAAITAMVDAIVHGRKRIMPAVAVLQGEYGLHDMAIGVPCILGESGIESIIELTLNEAEQQMFESSASAIRADIDSLK